MDKKYTVYKITNRFNGHIYVGCHFEKIENDRYMGSGLGIKNAIKKFGKKSFIKEILYRFDNEQDMLDKEKEIVTREFCMRDDTYNRIIGGGGYGNEGMATVVNPDGGYMMVYVDDPRYISGELKHMNKGRSMPEVTKNALSKIDHKTIHDDDARKRISDTIKDKYERGEINHTGEKRSEEFINNTKARRIKEVKDGSDKRCKRVGQYDKEWNLVTTWNSMGEAEREGGYTKSSIIIACKDNTRTHKKYYWKYIQ